MCTNVASKARHNGADVAVDEHAGKREYIKCLSGDLSIFHAGLEGLVSFPNCNKIFATRIEHSEAPDSMSTYKTQLRDWHAGL